jgi:small-conductance mechanosensitive channel
METRRIVFSIRVVYDISPDKLRQIPSILKEIVEEHSTVRFDRAHWLSFEESSLKFEVVYIVLSSDYNTYMDIQQTINLRIFEKFAEMEIGFAYPTRTIYTKSADSSNEGEGVKI